MRKATNQANNRPLITVIIPARNRAGLLPRTLASVRAQSFREFAVVLVDNDSTDATREVMRQWAEECRDIIDVTVITEGRHGSSHARNAGAACARTPWLMFFDSDDEMLPDHLAEMAMCAVKHPESDIIGRDVKIDFPDGHIITKRFTSRHPMFNHLFHSILATQRYMVRREIFNRAGKWDPHAWGWDDYNLGLRLLLEKPVIRHLPGVGVTIHSHPESITGTGFSISPAKWENTLDMCSENLRQKGRDNLEPWLDARRITLAAEYAREGSRSEARRLLREVTSRSRHGIVMRLLYIQHRLMGRGTATVASLMLPRVPKE